MTPRLSTLVSVSIFTLAALACTGPARDSGASKIAALDGSQVLVAPFNLGIRRAPELDRTTGAVASELVDALQDHGAVVGTLRHELALELWQEAFESGGGSDGFAEVATRFARLAAEEVEFDLVLLPSLLVRGAEVRGNRASWDGVKRRLPINGRLQDPSFVIDIVRFDGLEGLVTAASLHVVALRPGGTVALEGLAGLDVLQQATRGPDDAAQWQLEPHQAPLRDLEHVRQGVELAFERELPKTASAWQR